MSVSYPFSLPPLPYADDALAPQIDACTMKLHHDVYLGTYIKNLNDLLKNLPALQQIPLEKMLAEPYLIPENARTPVLQNGGGVYNHLFYFQGMSPHPHAPTGALKDAICREFGSLSLFTQLFTLAARELFGSGYVWLAADKGGELRLLRGENQQTPLSDGMTPLLALDLWEHAYFRRYVNRRDDYIAGWFSVIDWSLADRLYRKALARVKNALSPSPVV